VVPGLKVRTVTAKMAGMVALSIKQPWATLIVHGLKTVEVRRWSTPRRGRILIHAALVPDERPEGWAHVPPELLSLAKQGGGIIGEADLTGCVAYRHIDKFTDDQLRHLNAPAWYLGPVMFGFVFANPTVLPFRKYSGWMRFFSVDQTPGAP
jgi:ASCH domain